MDLEEYWTRRCYDADVLRFLETKIPISDVRRCVLLLGLTERKIPDALDRDLRSFVWTWGELTTRYELAWPSMFEMLRHNMSFYARANNLPWTLTARRMLAAWPMGHRLHFLAYVFHNVHYTHYHLTDERTMVQWGLRSNPLFR